MKVEKPHIFIVDDDESVRYMLETKFMAAGYAVTTAANGSHAIQVLQSGKTFSLMICDLKMQNKSGLEIIQHLKATNNSLPIVILTAFPDREKVMAAAALGVRDLLVKPVRHHELLNMVKSKLENSNQEGTSEDSAA